MKRILKQIKKKIVKVSRIDVIILLILLPFVVFKLIQPVSLPNLSNLMFCIFIIFEILTFILLFFVIRSWIRRKNISLIVAIQKIIIISILLFVILSSAFFQLAYVLAFLYVIRFMLKNKKIDSDKLLPSKITKISRAMTFVMILGIVALAYSFIRATGLNDSAALYIGMPFLLAMLVCALPRFDTPFVATMKGITIALLLSAIVFNEGYLCILFTAPLFYAVGGIFSLVYTAVVRNKKNKPLLYVITILLLLLSLEGTTTFITLPRDNEVVATQIIYAPIEKVRNQLANPINFKSAHPGLLKIFPYPVEFYGSGLNIGAVRDAKFVAYKKIFWNRIEGHLIFRVTESTPNKIVFSLVKDDSYLSHYLKWKTSEVYLKALDRESTRVTWKISYTRLLDPIWYFGALQQHAVKLAANELITNAATPKVGYF